MKHLTYLVCLTLYACGPSTQAQLPLVPEKAAPAVGWVIPGDFSGKGSKDTATVVQTQKGHGNPVEDGTPDAYEIQFSGKNIPSIPIGCCEATLVNEGDLTGNGTDAISVFQAPMNGCTYTLTTYVFSGNKWRKIIGPVLLPTGCEPLQESTLQEKVFTKNGTLYYLEADPNAETGGPGTPKAVSLP